MISNKKKLIIKNQNYIETYDLILELYRGKIYCDILKYFINLVIHKLGTKIFSIKKTYPRTLTNLLSSWLFTLYSSTTNNLDPFFPDSFEDTSALRETLLNFCKYDLKLVDSNNIINIILIDFLNQIKIEIKKLNLFKKSEYYKQIINKYTLTKYNVEQKRDNKIILFYKFKLETEYKINDKRLENILENILLPIDVYNKMCNNYNGPPHLLDVYIWSICYRYQLLGSNNHQLGVLPKIINLMEIDYNLSFECFASGINFTQKKYCSIYYDIEIYFGSYGSFFNLIPIEGTYSFNPPYQKDIINKGIYKILEHLENAKNNNKILTFILTIPVWDIEGQKIIGDEQKIDYGDFEIINIIKTSEFFIGLRMISKNDFTYLDHNFKLLKNKTIQNTYIIVLSTDNIDMTKIMKYNFFDE
jgi:hypothetical protein